ncbi:hypothetical protein BSKO_06312 [Bryopsis sp. KO-2023]|nr:hypothetical protein BSKO_06312 [Bryopsis sp. KO-2023]
MCQSALIARNAVPRVSQPRVAHRSRCVGRVSASASKTEQKVAIPSVVNASLSRREGLNVAGVALIGLAFPGAASAKLPAGFTPVKDKGDKYRFLYPFGWQEVTVDGQDIVFKDIIEPLESVSVTITPTDKTDITEFGDLNEVCFALADTVLTNRSQEVKLLGADAKNVSGVNYYEFEFAAKATNYIRRALSVVAVFDGKFYALTTGANERRWPKMEEKLKTVAKSFQVGTSTY